MVSEAQANKATPRKAPLDRVGRRVACVAGKRMQ